MRLLGRAIVALWLVHFAGCKSCELVEAELRHQTDQVQRLENLVLLRDAEINTLQLTLNSVRAEREQPGSSAPPEVIYRNAGISKITLGPLTGGRDLNDDGKHDAIQVVVMPHDVDDDIFKCPGDVHLELFEILTNGQKKPAGVWEVPYDGLRKEWRATMFGQGYQIVLPWQQLPMNPNLRVVVQFTTIDGRKFEAERDFKVSLIAKENNSKGSRFDPTAPQGNPGEICPPAAPTTDFSARLNAARESARRISAKPPSLTQRFAKAVRLSPSIIPNRGGRDQLPPPDSFQADGKEEPGILPASYAPPVVRMLAPVPVE